MDITNFTDLHDANNIRIESQVKKNQEFKLIGKLKRKPGLNLFSYNLKTYELKPADIEKKVFVGIDKRPVYKMNVVVEKDCFYFQALNLNSAKKKLLKYGNSL